MKKIILLTLFTLISLQNLIAQENNEIDLITSGKWHLEYLEMAGQKMIIPVEMYATNWVVFHADGKQEGMEDGQKYVGNWAYDIGNKLLKTEDLDGKVDQKIVSVTEKKLVVSVKEQGAIMIMGFTK